MTLQPSDSTITETRRPRLQVYSETHLIGLISSETHHPHLVGLEICESPYFELASNANSIKIVESVADHGRLLIANDFSVQARISLQHKTITLQARESHVAEIFPEAAKRFDQRRK